MLQFPCPLPVTPPSIQSSNQGDLYIFCEAWRYGTETPNSACCDVVLRECYAIIITDAATVITYLASFNVPVLGSHHHL